MPIPFRLAANLWKLQRVKFRRTEISYDCVVSEGYWTRTKKSSKRALSCKRALTLRILVGRLREVRLNNEHSQNRHCPETCLYNQVTVSYRPSVKSSRLQNSRFRFFAQNRFCKAWSAGLIFPPSLFSPSFQTFPLNTRTRAFLTYTKIRADLQSRSHNDHILERLRFTFTPNGRREFVTRDQAFPLFSVYSLLLLHKNKKFYASFNHRNRSGLFLSPYFLFWEILNFSLTFAVCGKLES